MQNSNIPLIRRRQKDGTLGPLEPMFEPQFEILTQTEMLLLETLAGMQEQLAAQQEEINELKGGA